MRTFEHLVFLRVPGHADEMIQSASTLGELVQSAAEHAQLMLRACMPDHEGRSCTHTLYICGSKDGGRRWGRESVRLDGHAGELIARWTEKEKGDDEHARERLSL